MLDWHAQSMSLLVMMIQKWLLEIKYLLLIRKDVRLPVQLQRAMAAEAEAAREARAKVI